METQFPMMALVTEQGTAMSETSLCSKCYPDTKNKELARSLAFETPASWEWVNCGENESLRCVACGFNGGEECEECGAFIPDSAGGDLVNKFHADSCSLYIGNVVGS